jgi:hypothetical protein
MDLTAAALGSLIGLVLAFTGAGGGILAIPVLVPAVTRTAGWPCRIGCRRHRVRCGGRRWAEKPDRSLSRGHTHWHHGHALGSFGRCLGTASPQPPFAGGICIDHVLGSLDDAQDIPDQTCR